jgi:hypothetical protein
MQRLALFHLALLAAAAPFAPALAQTVDGYEVTRSPPAVQLAPPGSVGRKTTEHEHRVGTNDDALWNEVDYTLTFGGFAKECPSAAGYADGDFEYTIAYDAVAIGDDGVTRREHHVRRLVATMKGEVDDNAKLVAVELFGTFTINRSGDGIAPENESRSVQRRFTPGPSGEPDFPAMEAAVRMTADIAVASVILQAGLMYRTAELVWLTPNKCAEMTFDPPTDTEAMRPNQEKEVRATVKSKGDGSTVRWITDNVNPLLEGTATPTHVPDALAATVPFKYTASARPRVRHGFVVIATSRAGIARGEWRIVDRYEGTFSQVDTAAAATVVTAHTNETLSGRIVWTSDNRQHPKSFGDDVPTAFYKATEGEITIESTQNSAGMDGSECRGNGRQTFALSALPPSVLEHLLLEIAGDGRYRLVLAILDYPQTPWSMEVVCTFPARGGRREDRRQVEGFLPAVSIGIQTGTLNPERGVVGEMAPQRRGLMTTKGTWDFKLAQ